jgi:hypothetical protein
MGCLISSQNLERLTRNSSEIHCSFFGKALARLLRSAKDAKIACKTINARAETVDPAPQGGLLFPRPQHSNARDRNHNLSTNTPPKTGLANTRDHSLESWLIVCT